MAVSLKNRWFKTLLTLGGIAFGLWFLSHRFADKGPTGKIKVLAPHPGSFEIYRMGSETPVQFVSEQMGQFNQDIDLAPGSYLILADCSSETVIVHPNAMTTLIADEVVFVPPLEPSPADKFSIQCNRYSETRSRQNATNRYRFHVLQGKRDLLVGMVPLTIDSTGREKEEPQTITYQLSAIQLAPYDDMKPKTSFFVSPSSGMISITETQDFGHWQFLMPGTYTVEVNGTRLEVKLAENEQRIIQPAFLKVNADPHISLERAAQIRSNPIYIELNGQHWLDLGETYPVLPGLATIKIQGSSELHEVPLEEGVLFEQTAKSVTVHEDCSPWEWTCLGSRVIVLYETDKPYPFSEGVTDVPLLFLKEGDIWVGVQGSRDIRYKLPNKQHTNLKVGKVKFIPEYAHKPGHLTDLARVEAIGAPFSGHTLDLQTDRDVEMPLLEGQYYFAQYITLTNTDGARRRQKDIIRIRRGQPLEIKFTVYVSEKKLATLQAAQKRREAYVKQAERRKFANQFHPAIPTKYQ